jgi:hypothetical protein
MLFTGGELAYHQKIIRRRHQQALEREGIGRRRIANLGV